MLMQALPADGDLSVAVSLHYLHRHLPTDRCEFAIQISHPSLFRVVAYQPKNSTIREDNVLGFEAVRLPLLVNQISLRNVQLLQFCVSRNSDNFHTVLKGARNPIQHISRSNEHHLGKIIIQVEIMIVEGKVLLRIQHLEKRRGGISPKVRRHFVDLIHQEDRIARAGFLHGLDNFSR